MTPSDIRGEGLHAAWLRCRFAPDPPGLEYVTGNNVAELRRLAKLLAVLTGNRRGAKFFAGSVSLAKVLGCSHVAARKRLKQLEELGVIRQTWRGGLCRRDEQGAEYAGGRLVRRGSEFEYLALPTALPKKV
jgi:hypothetical protein